MIIARVEPRLSDIYPHLFVAGEGDAIEQRARQVPGRKSLQLERRKATEKNEMMPDMDQLQMGHSPGFNIAFLEDEL
jgi:hypothetical protein